MNKLIMSALLGGLLGLSSIVSATPTLGTILGTADTITDTGASVFRLTDTTNQTAVSTILFEAASYESNFGIYSFNTDGDVVNTLQIFAASDEVGGATSTLTWDTDTNMVSTFSGVAVEIDDQNFGFYINVVDSGLTFYSQAGLNTFDQLLTFDIQGNPSVNGDQYGGADYILAWEDLLNNSDSDKDYNDMVIGVTDITAVPEPASLALLGLGLIGFGASRRRK